VAGKQRSQTVIAYPLSFLRFYATQGTLWNRYLARSVSLETGIAAIAGINENPTFSDWVFLVVEHPARPAVFKAVFGWDRRRTSDRSNLEGGNGLHR
jgi:hypothetical protein